MEKLDVLVIGGGISGASICYQLSRYNLKTMIVEKNSVLGDETTSGNSGLIHGGFDPNPKKINARLNVLGNKLWVKEIFPHLEFPRQKIDSLVLAFNEEEMSHVQMLYDRGIENGVKKSDLEILNKEDTLKRNKLLNQEIIGALLCTSSWAIDPQKAALSLFGGAKKNGVIINKNTQVTKIDVLKDGFNVYKNNEDKPFVFTKKIINAAGHYADQIADLANAKDFELKTRRGEYRILSKTENHFVKDVYFMVPTIHGKGVIIAPLLDGRVLVGPTSEENVKKDQTRIITPKMYELIGHIGNKIIPNLNLDLTEKTFSGSRSIDVETDDFIIRFGKNNQNFINVAGIKSPGLSSSPAIALEVEKLLVESGLE